MKRLVSSIKENFKKAKNYLVLGATTLLVFTTKAEKIDAIGFNQSQAKADIKKVLDPLTTFLLWGSVIFAGVMVGASYISWVMKDDDEREETPFSKVVQRIIVGLIFVAIGSAGVKWIVL